MQSDITLKSLFDEIVRTRDELKNVVEVSEARVLFEVEKSSKRLTELETENAELRNKIEFLERTIKKNNVILHGMNKSSHEISTEYICGELNSLLGITLEQKDISDTYTLGKGNNPPVKVELVSQLQKRSLIQNSHKLKGKGIYITHDLTEAQREENKILRKCLQRARQDKNNECYIKGNKLIINNSSYTPSELLEQEDIEDAIEKKNNSAPTTSSRSNLGSILTEEQIYFTSEQIRENTNVRGPVGSPAINAQTSSSKSGKNGSKILTRSTATKLK